MNKSLVLALFLFGSEQVKAAGVPFDYKTGNGADWPTLYAECGLTNQSPIDLQTQNLPFFDSALDNFQKLYTNQEVGIEIGWTGQTTQVPINKAGQDRQTFSSLYSKNQLKASETYTGVQFHFHAGSEHTIDGVRHDLELHTVHVADNSELAQSSGFGYAAMGVMFSVNEYNIKLTESQQRVIDKFFDSMKWTEPLAGKSDGSSGDHGAHGDDHRRLASSDENPIVDMVNYGDLIMMLNTDKRWVYKGSVTTPPCAQSVYWNVLQTIYPIKQAHYDGYKEQLKRGVGGDENLFQTGNYRLIQKYDNHNAQIMITPEINNFIIQEIVREFNAYQNYYNSLANQIAESEEAQKFPEAAKVAQMSLVNVAQEAITVMDATQQLLTKMNQQV